MTSSQVGEVGKKSPFWGGLGETNRNYTLGHTGSLLLLVYQHSQALYGARANVSLFGLFLARGIQVNTDQDTDSSSVSTDSLLDHFAVSLQEVWNTFYRPVAK